MRSLVLSLSCLSFISVLITLLAVSSVCAESIQDTRSYDQLTPAHGSAARQRRGVGKRAGRPPSQPDGSDQPSLEDRNDSLTEHAPIPTADGDVERRMMNCSRDEECEMPETASINYPELERRVSEQHSERQVIWVINQYNLIRRYVIRAVQDSVLDPSNGADFVARSALDFMLIGVVEQTEALMRSNIFGQTNRAGITNHGWTYALNAEAGRQIPFQLLRDFILRFVQPGSVFETFGSFHARVYDETHVPRPFEGGPPYPTRERGTFLGQVTVRVDVGSQPQLHGNGNLGSSVIPLVNLTVETVPAPSVAQSTASPLITGAPEPTTSQADAVPIKTAEPDSASDDPTSSGSGSDFSESDFRLLFPDVAIYGPDPFANANQNQPSQAQPARPEWFAMPNLINMPHPPIFYGSHDEL